MTVKPTDFRRLVETLDALIRLKRAAGRPNDHEVLAELETLRDRRRPY